jgi:hypothetical protein
VAPPYRGGPAARLRLLERPSAKKCGAVERRNRAQRAARAAWRQLLYAVRKCARSVTARVLVTVLAPERLLAVSVTRTALRRTSSLRP